MRNTKKSILIIMDGWGEGKHNKADAIYNTNTPNIDKLYNDPKVAKGLLDASGEEVGLPGGQMGNSEVGHMNIGAGRVVYQDLGRINKAVEDNSISENKELLKAFKYAKENGKKLHFLGLVSDGGVHSSMEHLKKLVDLADNNNLQEVFIHALMDGRDTDPKSGVNFISNIDSYISDKTAKIATVCGRYYTMDRDKRWERVKLGYDLMVNAIGDSYDSAIAAIEESYKNDITDEFIKPSVILNKNTNEPLATISEGDVVICFNFRTDRLREITTVLTQQDMPEQGMKTIPLEYYTMTRYDDNFKNVNIIYDKANLADTMGAVIANNGLKQLRIAETEKYPHVGFFFSGGTDIPFDGEERIMVSSPKVATYDLQPEMSAPEVTEKVVAAINSEKFDFICLNFANSDMVGHTGIYSAIQKAIETVDKSVGEVIAAAKAHDYSVLLTADHGNSDNAINEDGSPNTAHSLNKVPIFIINSDYCKMKDGRLSDIAPTMLSIMGIDIPEAMTGKVLVK
ncbi:MAG: 2,3-bisphosphoglycerate-independent phosphoglycerate mutase [Bacteroidetes bacterium]|nr:MAG: 2,3-bisphosphoglycerate-independent phosphoglycerate mutase [Bacteroidota bacterium]